MKTIALADLPHHVGEDLGMSEPRAINQDRVNLFADATDDHQWIHVDLERSRTGPFGGTIAHGYLTLALVPSMLKECLAITGARMGVNYGLNRLRFPAPLLVGARIRLGARLNDVRRIAGGFQIIVGFTVLIANDVAHDSKPCAAGEAIYNYYESTDLTPLAVSP